jgi:hypothetical protein
MESHSPYRQYSTAFIPRQESAPVRAQLTQGAAVSRDAPAALFLVSPLPPPHHRLPVAPAACHLNERSRYLSTRSNRPGAAASLPNIDSALCYLRTPCPPPLRQRRGRRVRREAVRPTHWGYDSCETVSPLPQESGQCRGSGPAGLLVTRILDSLTLVRQAVSWYSNNPKPRGL